MAAHYSTQADGSVALVTTNFADRKQARINAGQRAFKFEVVWSWTGEVLGTFKSRREADEFANGQNGPLMGNSSARRVMRERHPQELIPTTGSIIVNRAEA